MPRKPLDGVRVLDLSIVYAGPTGTRILAELGAEVIKIESPRHPEGSRFHIFPDNDPGDEPWNRGAYFIERNLGKRGMSLNLAHPRGKEIFLNLVTRSDVVVESFSPRVMEQLGLSYPVLKAAKEDIIMLSLSGYGGSGPWRDYVAFGGSLEAATGIAALSGYSDGPPQRTAVAWVDPFSGLAAAAAALAALRWRRRTGQGAHIDLSERETVLGLMGEAVLDFQVNRRQPRRLGNRDQHHAPQGCYPCPGQDRWVAISVGSDEEWARLAMILGSPPWAQNESYRHRAGRLAGHDDIDAHLTAWTRQRQAEEVADQLQAAGIAAGVVRSAAEIITHPQLQERGFFHQVDLPAGVGPRPFTPQMVARFSRSAVSIPGPAPRFGEHTHHILRQLLGRNEAELAALESQGVIASQPDPQLVARLRPSPWNLKLRQHLGILAQQSPSNADATEGDGAQIDAG